MKRIALLLAVSSMMLAACGSDDAAETPASSTSTASASVASADAADPAATPSPTSVPSVTDPDATVPDVSASAATTFPVTIEHKFGDTTIDSEPVRVVSVGFNEHDFLLALGVVPVGLREWYGDQPNGVWPWAQDELGDATPGVISPDAINFEQIAALDPDLIVGVWSGMTAQDYDLLAAIAPTVAQPDAYDDYGTPWQEQTMILGRATGRVAEAEAVVAALDERFAGIRDAHPDWSTLQASVAFVFEGAPGAYTSQDTRSRIMADLGFAIPAVNDSAGENSFYLEMSPENIDALDVDLLVWTYSTDEELDVVLDGLPTRPSLDVAQQGREVFADAELTAAFSHASPLSLDYALDRLVPEIEAAVDGDPSTGVPSAVEAGAVERDGGDDASTDPEADFSAEEQAVADAWMTVFDSTIDHATKAPSLADAASLQATVEAYAAAGDGLGGISLVPTAVAIDGDTAEVTYDVNFGENPAYSGQVGTIERIDGTWVVSRDEFCAFMSSARVSCEP